jgi:hypothetical protein
MLLMVERGRFAGCANRGQAVSSLLDMPIYKLAQPFPINFAVAERRNQSDRQSREALAFGGWPIGVAVGHGRAHF